jgi:phenylalanyl-tRNA synthetase beta chain
MRLVLSWLREFVDVTASAEDVAGTLALRGFEVASIEALDGGDAVIDFEVTANRPDALSVAGLAREVATAYDLPLKATSGRFAPLPTGTSDRISVRIDDEELCPRFAAAVAEVKMGSSPGWMAARLQAAGVRPISNIVDITNYVNLELGQPMHAYDLARLAGASLTARRATPGETATTLDGVERKLDADMLVIADRDRPQGVAGVMGGAASEVSATTTTIVLEAAYFNPVSIRRTSKRLGLKTEASSRFERGGDISAQVLAIQRAVALMQQIGAGQPVGSIVDCYPRPQPEQVPLHLRHARIQLLLGIPVPGIEVMRILRGLGLTVIAAGDGWDVAVPPFRVDLLREVDLIEEVGRHYGFDKLEATFPPMTQPAPAADPRIPRDRLVRRVLTAAGFSEAVTFGFIEAKAVDDFEKEPQRPQRSQSQDSSAVSAVFAVSSDRTSIANPLSGKFDTLRPSLLPGLVDAVAHNRRHGRRDVQLFEIGTRFAPSGETRAVAIAWTGAAAGEHWSGSTREADFFDVKGAVEHLADTLGVGVRVQPVREPFLVAGQTAAILVADGPERGARVGVAGQLMPALADVRGLPRQDRVLVAELDLDLLQRARVAGSDAARPLPRHPFVVRDLSIVVADSLPAEIIRDTILAAGRNLPAPLAGLSVFDRYQGKGVPSGAVSLSVRLTFQAAERTLTDAEVQHSVDTILAALVREHAAVQR